MAVAMQAAYFKIDMRIPSLPQLMLQSVNSKRPRYATG